MRETSGMGGGTKRWFEDVIRGRRALPVWMQVAFVPIAVLVVVRAATERGLAVGAVAALTYGYIAISQLRFTREWTARRSDLGNHLLGLLFITSLFFLLLSLVWSRSTAVCAAAALLGGVTLTCLTWVLGRRLAGLGD